MTKEVIVQFNDRMHFLECLKVNPGIIILKFGADWCGPCRTIKDVLEEKFAKTESNVICCDLNLNNLLHLFMLNYDKMVNLKELITNLFKKTDIGGWYDNQYDFYDDKLFDSVSFNREVYRQFNDIIDIMEKEGILDEYLKMYDRSTSKFVIGNFYPLPHNKRYQFQIELIDYEDNKIKLILRDKENNRLARLPKLDEKGFMKFVYNPQLFGLKDFFE